MHFGAINWSWRKYVLQKAIDSVDRETGKEGSHDLKTQAVPFREHFAALTHTGTSDKPVRIDYMCYTNKGKEYKHYHEKHQFPSAVPVKK